MRKLFVITLAIVSAVAASVVSAEDIYQQTGFMKGVTFGAMYWPEEQLDWIDYNLERLRDIGVNAITLVVDWYVEDYTDPSIEPWFRDRPNFPDTDWYFPTLYDHEVREIIEKAHALDMLVMLKPHVETLDWADGAPGRYALQQGIGRWDELFGSYTNYMLHYAQMCEELGVEILSLGCELESMTHSGDGRVPNPDERWRELIADVRDEYNGKLTYSCSFHGTPSQTWSSPNHITFWDALDYIGFEIYRGLTWKRNPTVAELKEGVHDIFDRFVKPLAGQYGIPVIVTEISYYSYDGVNTTPIDPPGARLVDHQEQADCYDAVLEAVEEILAADDYLKGLFWWAGYLVDPADESQASPRWVLSDRYDPIWHKPAEDVLRSHWGEGEPVGNQPALQDQGSERPDGVSVDTQDTVGTPLIVAHRGASQEAPENTIPAFELAWEQGADAIEGDFRQTQDGQIVCIHDSTTGRVAGRDLLVSRSTLESLRQLDVGEQWGEEYRGTRIPTLAEVLATVPEGKKIYIEIKTDESIIANLLEEVAKSGLDDNQIVIISFNSGVIREIKRQVPQYRALWLSGLSATETGDFTPSLADILEVLGEIDADGFSSSWDLVNASLIQNLIEYGYEYHVWTVNDVETAERFISWGVSSITTNVPGSMMGLPRLDVTGFTSNLLPLHVEGRHVLDADGNEVILRGAAVDHYPPAISPWGDGPVLKRDLVLMREWGANAVRIPVFPSDFFAHGEEEHLRAYVDPLVRWAGELGLYVDLSWHTNGDPLLVYEHASAAANPDIQLAKDAWKTISRRYADCHWVLFQVFAEPDHVTWEVFRPMMTELVDIIRGNAPDSIVIVPGTNFAADLSEIPAAPIARSNILYATDVYPWVLRTDWEDDLKQMLNSDLAVLVAEWGFGSRFGGHLATSTDFGFPAIDLFDRYGIGWLTWQLTHYPAYEIRMFQDYERMQPVGPGIVMYESLVDSRNVMDVLGESPVLEVAPGAALSAGCRVIDLLEEMEDGSSYTMIRADAAAGWEFIGWQGDVDYPGSTIVSVPRNGQRLVAQFGSTEPHPYEVGLTESAAIGSMPQGMEVVGQTSFVVDWGTGVLLRVDNESGAIRHLADGFSYVTDIASIGERLLIVTESGEAWTVDAQTGEKEEYTIDAQFSGEVLGVEHVDGTLYLLSYTGSGPEILEIGEDDTTRTAIQPGLAGEMISLQLWNGRLLTLDYQAGIVYELVREGSAYSIEICIDLAEVVPWDVRADGGIRGMFFTDEAWYFTSVSVEGNQGKLHVVDVSE